jgi:CRP/FNR family transcriptional regulator, anaerobic regulatory protein
MTVVPIYRLASRHPQAEVCAACEVRGSALFGALDDDGLDRIHTRIASLDLAPDAPVYGRGSDGAAMFTIRAGVVRFERFTERGDRRIVRLAGRGDLIGQEALLRRPYADEAIACTPVQLCRIPSALVDELGQPSSPLMRELMSRWQQALDDAEAWVADLSSGPVRRRVLRLLLRLAEHVDAEGCIWLPRREEIGAMLDMTFETASRQISRLRREAILDLSTGRRARLDLAALRQAVRDEDAV